MSVQMSNNDMYIQPTVDNLDSESSLDWSDIANNSNISCDINDFEIDIYVCITGLFIIMVLVIGGEV